MTKCVNKQTRELCDISEEKCKDAAECEIAPDISIVVPALNERYNIPKLLDSIRKQETKYDFETVIADNGSDDGTYEYLKEQEDVRVTRVKEKGIPNARNGGVLASKAPYILQTDADVELPPDWVEKMGNKLINTDDDVISGSVTFNSPNPLQNVLISSVYGIGLPIYNTVQKVVPHNLSRMVHSGANLGITRKAFNELNGYNPEKKWLEVPDLTTRANQSGMKSGYVMSDPVQTSSRRYGDTVVSTLSKMAHIGMVTGLTFLGVDQQTDYKRVD